ncbi:MAG: SpoIIE family protein phosphatase [Bacteroidia bacterium]|nr:SpoIIE family protein phosphatase [Bacteroidia bacterium]
MAFHFTIGRKLGSGFGILIVLTVVAFILTNVTINESKKKTNDLVNITNPSVTALEEFNLGLQESKTLITKWKHIQSNEKEAFKDSLRQLISHEFPKLIGGMDSLKIHWAPDDQKTFDTILVSTKALFEYYRLEIMDRLVGWDNYEDDQNVFLTNDALDQINVDVEKIFVKLASLIKNQNAHAADTKKQMFKSFNLLQLIVKWLGLTLVVGGILIAFFTVRSIVKPVKKLKGQLQSMSLGILPEERMRRRGDEIGDMNMALNELVESMERTTEFARQVGSGNFESYFKPLSEHDTLGHALLGMRSDLRETERILEQKVIERTEEVVRQKEEIVSKNEELEIIYKHVTDSIRYAKRIQEAILPPDSLVKKLLPESFILYKPKDIVSGDFYWVAEKEGKVFFAAVDCTGHGVPGAFMSIVGYNLLKEIISSQVPHTPASIMDKMKTGVSATLHHGQSEDNNAKDGMDMSMCSIDFEKMECHFAGAFNPMYLIRNGTLQQFHADKFPVGLQDGTENQRFSDNVIQLQKGDMIYVFSDGYADQFGGPRGKKFMVSHFRELLLKAQTLSVSEQKEFLFKTIEDWRGELEQVDDILVIGVRV